MPRKFEGNDARRDRVARQQGTTLDRLRKAVEALDQENRDLQAEVEEFQGQIGGLRRSVGGLAHSADDHQFRDAGEENESLSGASRAADEMADNWGKDTKDALDAPSAQPSRDMA